MTHPGPYGVPVLLFDIETNGLLDKLTKAHCMTIKDASTGVSSRYNDQPVPVVKDGSIEQGVRRLQEATDEGHYIAGHNVIKFDIPALNKLYPWFKPNLKFVRDTLVFVRLLYPNEALIEIDLRLMARKVNPLPGNLFKRQSLEAWGYRLGVFKDEYSGDPSIPDEKARKERKWESWNQSMDDYCVQDVEATHALWGRCMEKVEGIQFAPPKPKKGAILEPFSLQSVTLEHDVACIIAAQERFGICFDAYMAGKLLSEMVKEKLKIDEKLKLVFKPRYFTDGKEMTPSVSRRDQEELLGINYDRPLYEGKGKNKTLKGCCFKSFDYTEGAPYSKVKLVEFNPSSRVHIAIWLKALHGWEPTEFTADGSAKVDEKVLEKLPFPEAKVFNSYLTICKRLGQLSEGKESWLRHEVNGRIHGQMITNGAVTGRATHSNPNMGQVPSVRVGKDEHPLMGLEGYWGYECRALFGPPPGYIQVGIDMSGIELRCLAHFMARYDGGAYGRIVVDGDIHTENQKAAGLPTRGNAKTFIYAFLYGAGGEKIGAIIGKGAAAGEALKKRFLRSLPALGKLIDAVTKAASRGYLKGIDGRILKVRHKHAALNTLLQSCGAILSKQWMVIFHAMLEEAGLADKVHQMLWVHDEIQLACPPELAERVGKMAVEAIVKTGEFFNFRVPITGEYKIGKNWAECH